MITFSAVSFDYDGLPVLQDVSLAFREGETTALIGPNGAGKSTLARLALGLLLPSSGTVEIDGLSTAQVAPSVVRRLVGLAWQNPDNQLVCGIVEEDVAFGPENLGLPVREINRRVDEVLERLRLTHLRSTPVQRLSAAEKQLVAVAGAMTIQPRYLILDEVTARLDPSAAHEFLEAVTGWATDHSSGIVMITHHLAELMRADSVVRLEKSPSGAGVLGSQGLARDVLREAKVDEDLAMETPLYNVVHHLELSGVTLQPLPETMEQLIEALCKLPSPRHTLPAS
jgi:energy-coupling factor transport system ATP-binding protein